MKEDDTVTWPIHKKVDHFVSDVFGGAHHVAKLERKGHYYQCVPYGTLATYDDDRLTRVVIAAHKYGLRAEVDNYGMRGVKILLHNRASRTGRMWERHPTLDKVMETTR